LCPVIAVEAMVQKRLGSVGEGEWTEGGITL
jgi:hypothetical protein